MSVAANRYSRALMDVLYPDHAEAALEQLESFAALLKEQPDARRLLENPTMAGDRRNNLLKEIASALGFDRRVANFVGILLDNGRLALLEEIIDAYQRLLDDRMGIVRARITAARPLDAAQQSELEMKLMERTGKKIRMEVAIDPSLIGGVVAQVGSTIYDGSVRTQLQAFKNRLVEEN
jgi:F-type H+-transporting ATPase subunit delta